MEVWIPVITAAFGILGGYIVAFQQGRNERHKIAEENKRLREDRDAQARDQRRADYLAVVNKSRELTDVLQGRTPYEPSVRGSYVLQLQGELGDTVNAAALSGSPKVARLARGLRDEHMGGQRPGQIQVLEHQLVEAMREDLGATP